jgi:NDP-sugar pyrophosphorylase family protein
MPDLLTGLIEHGVSVRSYRFAGEWHDVGTPDRLEEARRSVERHAAAYGLADQAPDPLKGDIR